MTNDPRKHSFREINHKDDCLFCVATFLEHQSNVLTRYYTVTSHFSDESFLNFGLGDAVAVEIDSMNSRRILQLILCRPCVYGAKIATSMLITPPSTANVVRRGRKPFQ